MESDRLGVGLVGLGLAANSHVKGYAGHPTARVLQVCDLDRARAERFATDLGIPGVAASFEELLSDPGIDAVDICTPTFLHSPMARQAAEVGKHVLCEKPFCRFPREGLAACAAAEQNGVVLGVGETYVFLSSHIKARELIEAGEIGRPLQLRQRHGAWLARADGPAAAIPADRAWRLDPEQSGGGVFPWIFDHAVHFFATAEYLMLDCRIEEVYALTARAGQQQQRRGADHDPYTSQELDIPIITWKYEDPACQGVWMRAERLNGKYDFRQGFSTAVVGEHGLIEVLGEGGGNLFWQGEPQHLVLHREGKQTVCFRFDGGGDDVWQSDLSYYSSGHIKQVHHFVDCIRFGDKPRYDGRDGVRAVRCTLAAIRSAQSSRPVRVDAIEDDFSAY